MTSAHDPGLVGQTIAYTATVAVATPGSGTPTGTASFSDGGNPIPGCQGLALSPAPPLVVTCPQAYDTTASQDITVAYSGDANFTASAGAMTENVVAGVHHDRTRPLARRVDVGPERHAHRHREPDVGNGRPGRLGLVHLNGDPSAPPS